MAGRALRIYAGPRARQHIQKHGLGPQDVSVIPGAAGGPKGLVLGALDRFIFGEWMPRSKQRVHLVGASIGAWRLATACLEDAVPAFERLERDYIAQDYELEPGRKTPTARQVSEQFAQNLQDFYGGHVGEVLDHPRYRLHIITSRGRHLLSREHRIGTPVGYLGAYLSNSVYRRALGAWLERVVFSSGPDAGALTLPFDDRDFRTRQVHLTAENFHLALQASCSIPFMLQAVHDIPGAPRGAYWDGGITDYHLHLDYASMHDGLALYPHFQRTVVPGWLDKGFKRRHRASAMLDNLIVLYPNPAWIATLPNGKLPDRADFKSWGEDVAGRQAAWTRAVHESERLRDDFAEWLDRPEADAL
jgi:hypothetical protein